MGAIDEAWRSRTSGSAPLRALLRGASVVYGIGRALDRRLHDAAILKRRRLPIPAVSIGNLAAGGSGKTPLCAWLANELHARGLRVLVLGRGYRRRKGARLNDEGRWLELAAPAAIVAQGPDRHAVATAVLAREPCDLALLDDGFQHESLARDLDVVLLDARAPFGNGFLLPRGPLREPAAALARARFVLATRAELVEPGAIEALRREVAALAPGARFGSVRFGIAALRRGSERHEAGALSGRAAVVMCGVGSPSSVLATVERSGARIAGSILRPDHHDYSELDLSRARERARELGAELVVTSKDAVKLDALPGAAGSYWVLEQEVDVEGGGELVAQACALAEAARARRVTPAGSS